MPHSFRFFLALFLFLFLFCKKTKTKMSQIPTSPLPPLPLNKNKEVVYTVRTIWEWVFEVALSPSLPHVLYHDLPSVPSSTVEGKGGKKRRRRPDRPALARFEWYEVGEEDGEGKEKGERKGEAWWCVSGLMDPLRHKDLLVKSLSFSSLQWATPPSLLFPPTPEEIEELMEKVKRGEKGGFEVWEDVETPVPPLKWFREKLGVEGPSSSYSSPSSLSPSSSPSPLPRYVLKPPMGCQGEGIQFVENLEEGFFPTLFSSFFLPSHQNLPSLPLLSLPLPLPTRAPRCPC